MPTNTELRDVIGSRGENIVELCLTDYRLFPRPLFRPGFLGDKWPAIDFYVELTSVRGKKPYFFAQIKTTGSTIMPSGTHLNISTKKKDVEKLVQIPGPTYIFGVHEPTMRAFVRSVCSATPVQAITRIPLAYELTSANLQALHGEVRDFWAAHDHKPATSRFL